MITESYKELLHQQAVVNSQIRAHHIVLVRRAHTKRTVITVRVRDSIVALEKEIAKINRDYTLIDDCLDYLMIALSIDDVVPLVK